MKVTQRLLKYTETPPLGIGKGYFDKNKWNTRQEQLMTCQMGNGNG